MIDGREARTVPAHPVLATVAGLFLVATLVALAAHAHDPGTVQLTVRAHDSGGGDFYFTTDADGPGNQNPLIELDRGATYEITLENQGSRSHSFRLGGPVDEQTDEIDPTESDTITVEVPWDAEDTTFQYWCTVTGHRGAGMEGNATHTGGNDAPTLAVDHPGDGDEVQGTVDVAGSAGDPNDGPVTVEVKTPSSSSWADAGSGGDWTFSWDTTGTDDGEHTLRVRITDHHGAEAFENRTVQVSNAPEADFDPVCDDLECSFDGSPTDAGGAPIASYDWDLGDGTTATGETATHTYDDGGTYTVTLTVTDEDGRTDTATRDVTVSPPDGPTAAFTDDCDDLECTFDASSTQEGEAAISSHEWSLGDGTSATGPVVNHTYEAGGTYGVTLTVTDENGQSDSTTRNVSVTPPEGPTAAFTYDCPDLNCTFDASPTEAGEAAIASHGWSLGDGTDATGPVVNHTYGEPETYTITLTVTDENGRTDTATRNLTVTPEGTLVADITHDCTHLACTYDASGSTGPITSYAWDLGDGTTASGETLNHTYPDGGTYRVHLTVSDGEGGHDVATLDVTVTPPPELDAAFTVDCFRLGCRLDASPSTPKDAPITAYDWSLGDGANATGPTVNHTYDLAASYVVTLTVTDEEGRTDAASRTVTVVPPQGPTAAFTARCDGLRCVLDASSSEAGDAPIASHAWHLRGIGNATGEQVAHTYQGPGVYGVHLTVTDEDGRTDTRLEAVRVIQLTASATRVTPDEVRLEGLVEGAADPVDVLARTPEAAEPLAATTVEASGNWTLTWNASRLEPGNRTLHLEARTGQALATRNLTVDVPAPTRALEVEILTPRPGDAVSGTVTVAVEAQEAATVDVGFESRDRLHAAAPVEDTPRWQATLDADVLAVGEARIVAVASDGEREGEATRPVEVVEATASTAPRLEVLAEPPSPASGLVTIDGRLVDEDVASPPLAVELRVDGDAVDRVSTDAGRFTLSWQTRRVPDGVHGVTIQAFDGVAASEPATFEVRVANGAEAAGLPGDLAAPGPGLAAGLVAGLLAAAAAGRRG